MLTWTEQYGMAQSLASDADSTNLTLIKNLLREGQGVVERVLGIYFTEETRTFTTLTNAITGTSNQAYRLPENFVQPVNLYVTVGSNRYVGTQIHDEELWQQLNSTTTTSTSNYLQFYFLRNDRLELYPIPSSACTATFIYRARSKPLQNEDYTTGTITTLTNGTAAVVGNGSTWTSAMVGRYFKVNADNEWYKISAFGTATTLTLSSLYQGVSIAAGTSTYTIGEMPITPSDTHILPVYFALWRLAMMRKDVQMSREWERSWKEGLKIAEEEWRMKASSQLLDKGDLVNAGRVNPNWYPEGMT